MGTIVVVGVEGGADRRHECGGGDDRPSDADWDTQWTSARAAVPTADELLDGGQPLCDQLVGEFRQVFADLTPTPTEALDGSVIDWIDLAESIAFDCTSDRAELDRRYDELYVLEAEIDAGLRTDSG